MNNHTEIPFDDKSLIVEPREPLKRKRAAVNRLSPKQAAFVYEYVKTQNLKQAVINAGYVAKNQIQQGNALLALDNVRKSIQKLSIRIDHKDIVTFEEKLSVLKDHLHCGDRDVSIRAANELNKMQGHYAPVKNINLNLDLTIEAFETLNLTLEDY